MTHPIFSDVLPREGYDVLIQRYNYTPYQACYTLFLTNIKDQIQNGFYDFTRDSPAIFSCIKRYYIDLTNGLKKHGSPAQLRAIDDLIKEVLSALNNPRTRSEARIFNQNYSKKASELTALFQHVRYDDVPSLPHPNSTLQRGSSLASSSGSISSSAQRAQSAYSFSQPPQRGAYLTSASGFSSSYSASQDASDGGGFSIDLASRPQTYYNEVPTPSQSYSSSSSSSSGRPAQSYSSSNSSSGGQPAQPYSSSNSSSGGQPAQPYPSTSSSASSRATEPRSSSSSSSSGRPARQNRIPLDLSFALQVSTRVEECHIAQPPPSYSLPPQPVAQPYYPPEPRGSAASARP